MVEYTKNIYPLEDKSKDDVQYYGFIISIDGKPTVRQWHKPKVSGIVLMTKEEATKEADNMIASFNEQSNLSPFELPNDKIIKLEERITKLEKLLK